MLSKPKKITKIKISEPRLRELASKGLSIPELAQLFHCSYTTIKFRLLTYNIPYSKSPLKLNLPDEELFTRYMAGTPIKALAEEYQVSLNAIRSRIARYQEFKADEIERAHKDS